jgi:hypothetical protein
MTNWTERLLEAIDRLTSHGDSPNGPGHRLILTVDVDELERLAAEARAALAQPELQGPTVIGPEWQPCVKLPITVHVREQRPGETHSSTREGITPLRPDDLIMRGVQGEEYPIGRELFNQTYRMEAALAQPEPEGVGLSDEKLLDLADDCGLEKQEITTWDGESRTVDHGWECTDAQLVTFATALITRYARPTIKPVPVAERPWEREKGWRDPDGECWWCPPDGPPYWQMANPAMVYGGWLLPAHALPVPYAEDGQP